RRGGHVLQRAARQRLPGNSGDLQRDGEDARPAAALDPDQDRRHQPDQRYRVWDLHGVVRFAGREDARRRQLRCVVAQDRRKVANRARCAEYDDALTGVDAGRVAGFRRPSGKRADVERFFAAGLPAGRKDQPPARRSLQSGAIRAAARLAGRIPDSGSLASNGGVRDGDLGERAVRDGKYRGGGRVAELRRRRFCVHSSEARAFRADARAHGTTDNRSRTLSDKSRRASELTFFYSHSTGTGCGVWVASLPVPGDYRTNLTTGVLAK